MKRGSILITALWTLFFLSALALAVGANVSANIKLATRLQLDYRSGFAARAGVERAIIALSGSDTNAVSGAGSEYWSLNNDSLAGCTFSVTHVAVESDNLVTNYGIGCESSKYNINNPSDLRALLNRRMGKNEASGVMAEVTEYWKAKKTQAAKEGKPYYKFRIAEEFMQIGSITPDIFIELKPYITVYESTCYGGSASAYDNDNPGVSSRIDFVYDRKRDEIVYWRQ